MCYQHLIWLSWQLCWGSELNWCYGVKYTHKKTQRFSNLRNFMAQRAQNVNVVWNKSCLSLLNKGLLMNYQPANAKKVHIHLDSHVTASCDCVSRRLSHFPAAISKTLTGPGPAFQSRWCNFIRQVVSLAWLWFAAVSPDLSIFDKC